jgi:ATP-dependent Clp protease ATP-binding subunit ClpA
MFERFTDRARRVVVMAQEEAGTLDHSYVGTEHILLALLELEDGSGILTGLGLGKAATEARITEQLPGPVD